MNLDRIPQTLKDLRQWVCVHGGSKVPMRAFSPNSASSTDPSSWSSFENAVRAVKQGHYDNVGFVFADNGIVGIDIDCGWTEDGLLSPLAFDILSRCQSYTELSRSKRGFHILLKGTLPFKGKNNLNGVEIYQSSRYFIMTGDVILFPEIRENQGAIDSILNDYFQETERESAAKPAASRIYKPEWELPRKRKEDDGNWRVKLRPVYPRIPAGSRNICLTSLAGMMHNQGYSKTQIYDELFYANTVACDPSLDKRELRTIVNSVTRYKR